MRPDDFVEQLCDGLWLQGCLATIEEHLLVRNDSSSQILPHDRCVNGPTLSAARVQLKIGHETRTHPSFRCSVCRTLARQSVYSRYAVGTQSVRSRGEVGTESKKTRPNAALNLLSRVNESVKSRKLLAVSDDGLAASRRTTRLATACGDSFDRTVVRYWYVI